MSNPTEADIISPDVHRDNRVPPRQALTRKWPVLHAGSTPHYQDLSQWTFHIFGLVERPWECTHAEFTALPRTKVHADMHCVTRWSKLDNVWEGVSTREVMKKVTLKPEARFPACCLLDRPCDFSDPPLNSPSVANREEEEPKCEIDFSE